MRKNSWLYRSTAFVMLFLFTLSITPRLYLHDWLANHTDSVFKETDTGKAQVCIRGFSCDVNNWVATSPFIEQEGSPDILLFSVYQQLVLHFPSQMIAQTPFFFELRGPPAIG